MHLNIRAHRPTSALPISLPRGGAGGRLVSSRLPRGGRGGPRTRTQAISVLLILTREVTQPIQQRGAHTSVLPVLVVLEVPTVKGAPAHTPAARAARTAVGRHLIMTIIRARVRIVRWRCLALPRRHPCQRQHQRRPGRERGRGREAVGEGGGGRRDLRP